MDRLLYQLTSVKVLQEQNWEVPSIYKIEYEKFIEYASTNGYYFSTNVYTALKRYFEDFGMWGIVFIPLISGFCYDIFYRYINKSEKDLSKIFYAMLIYPIIYYPIMEQMFTRMHLGTVYEIMWMYVLFNILCKNSIIEENNKLWKDMPLFYIL